ncbi:MAG: FdhF/YdeP family oxidoreductase [Bacteroidota bacterium]
MNPLSPAQAPETPDHPNVRKAPQLAGGFPAIWSALRMLREELPIGVGLNRLLNMNQITGFDCPGCAWPDPDDKRSVLGEYCENGAKALAEEATQKRVDPDFFAKYSIADLLQATDHWLGKQGRLTHPMYLPKGGTHYQAIAWEAAFQLIGTHLKGLNSPDEAIFYTSGRTSNEAAFLYQLFVRMFGTNNLPDCSNMCHESSGQGLSQTVGIGKGSVTLEDLYQAEVIVVAGQNPGTNHPRMLTALQKCKQNGGKIITVNPLPEVGLMRFKHPQKPLDLLGKGTQLTDVFLQVQINGDIALAKALMRCLVEAEEAEPGKVLDQAFIAAYTEGFEALKEDLDQYEWVDLIAKSGVEEAKIREAADLLIRYERIIICWAMGLTQHVNGVANVKEMVNLLLMKGAIGKPGAGTCPVRGHSNVQGDRTMGIWEKPPQAFLDRLQAHFGFDPPREHGYDTVHAIQAMQEERAKVFIAMGGNFLSASPDTAYTAEALRNCQLTVQISTKLNRSHLVHGAEALILPCLSRSESDVQAGKQQAVSVENSMGKVHPSKGSFPPASPHLRSEPAIVQGMAQATLPELLATDWTAWIEDYDRIRELIQACVPGFENYNQRLREGSGFYLPNGARERSFNTPDGKAHFSLNAVPNTEVPEGVLQMMTIRSHDQYNTTIYGLDDRYRGIKNGRRVLLMNPADLREKGLQPEQLVHITSKHEGQSRLARNFRVIPFDISPGCCATYFPEANVLVPIGHHARGSHTPASKQIMIWIDPA